MIISGPTMIEMFMAAESTLVLPKIAEWTVMCYPTTAQHHSAVNKVAEGADIVQDHQHSGACRQPLGQHIGKHLLMFEVNSRRGLVQDEQVGMTGKCACHQDPLLLAAGQHCDVGVQLFGQPDQSYGVMYRLAIASAQRSEWPSVG
jgi:hypothetical protein